jgi:hypothetical protein
LTSKLADDKLFQSVAGVAAILALLITFRVERNGFAVGGGGIA